jgi:hypothetical protein
VTKQVFKTIQENQQYYFLVYEKKKWKKWNYFWQKSCLLYWDRILTLNLLLNLQASQPGSVFTTLKFLRSLQVLWPGSVFTTLKFLRNLQALRPGSLFTTLKFLRNLKMDPIS